VAVKVPVVEPEPTVTDAGTVRLGLLLESDTGRPAAGAGVFIVAVQLDDPLPWREEGTQATDSTVYVAVEPETVIVPPVPVVL
jgi:hypothetical protein